MFWAVAVLAGVAISAVCLWRNPTWPTAAALVALSLGWLLVNGPLEGPVLLRLDTKHGLTVADLLTPLALLLAGSVLVRHHGGRR